MLRPAALFLIVSVALASGAGASTPPPESIRPFSTDGCSVFSDRALIGEEDWCDCCVAHDLAYWRGGTAEERESADASLRSCVAGKTGNKALADMMYAGVRSGGSPHFYTSYRWGYGWAYGRGYQALSPSEQAAAAEQEAIYRAANPALACPAR